MYHSEGILCKHKETRSGNINIVCCYCQNCASYNIELVNQAPEKQLRKKKLCLETVTCMFCKLETVNIISAKKLLFTDVNKVTVDTAVGSPPLILFASLILPV